MKNVRCVRKLLVLLLVAAMVLSLVGCFRMPEPEYDNTLHLLSKSGVSVFRIVHPQTNCPEEIADGTAFVQFVMQYMLGVKVDVVSDRDRADASDLVLPYEILIGKTARRETVRVLEACHRAGNRVFCYERPRLCGSIHDPESQFGYPGGIFAFGGISRPAHCQSRAAQYHAARLLACYLSLSDIRRAKRG